MLVSLIVPVYNCELYLERCLDSLVNQEFEKNEFEVIIVNDGSKDNSGVICNKYAKIYSNIKYFEKENGGQSSARNLGLKNATGEYILFVDSDDFIKTDTLKRFYEFAKSNSADIVHGKCIVCDENGIPLFSEIKHKYVDLSKAMTGTEYIKCAIEKNCYDIALVTNFVKSSLLRSADISFLEGYYTEDHLFSMQVLLNARKVVELDYPFYFYRRHANSTTTVVDLKKMRDLLCVIDKMIEYLNQLGNSNKNLSDLYSVVTFSYCILVNNIKKMSKTDIKIIYSEIDKKKMYQIIQHKTGNKLGNIQCRLFLFSPSVERIATLLITTLIRIKNSLFNSKQASDNNGI